MFDLVKLDVQGWELEILLGLDETLRRSPAVRIVAEFWPGALRERGRDPAEVLRRYLELGYALRAVIHGEPAELALRRDCGVCDSGGPDGQVNLLLEPVDPWAEMARHQSSGTRRDRALSFCDPDVTQADSVSVQPEADSRRYGPVAGHIVGERSVWMAPLFVIVAELALIGWLIRNSYYTADDWIMFSVAKSNGLSWRTLGFNLYNHFAPVEWLLHLFIQDVAPLDYGPGMAIILALCAGMLFALWWTLNVLEAPRPVVLGGIIVIGTSPFLVELGAPVRTGRLHPAVRNGNGARGSGFFLARWSSTAGATMPHRRVGGA